MDYYRMIQAEVTLIAELLNMFDGYKELPHEDKVEIFRHYWIYFVVLERNFDTFLVLGANMDDKRMVFPNGDILDVINCEYDISKVTDKSIEEVRLNQKIFYAFRSVNSSIPGTSYLPRNLFNR